MITYSKECYGLWLLLQYGGTSWPAGIVPGLVSAGIGLVLNLIEEADETISDKEEFIENAYPFQLFAYLVGFLMVFRTNFAYARYWDSLDAVQRMGAKWMDGACMAIAFDSPGDSTHPHLTGPSKQTGSALFERPGAAGPPHSTFFCEICHLFSLLHAIALQHLRCDTTLENLLEEFPEDNLADDPNQQATALRLSYLGEAPAPSQEAHRAAGGKSFGAKSFKRHNIATQLSVRKLRILGKLLPEESRALQSDSTGRDIPSAARVTMVECWIMRRIVARQKHEPHGDMGKTSPPILSRMHQVISDGCLAFNQAAKVAEIPFPFPYHNLIRCFLWMFGLTVPFVVNSKVLHDQARFIINFIVVWAYFSLAEVGDNLEDPFLPYDPNELPLQDIQHSFNARLLALGVIPTEIEMPFTIMGEESTTNAANGSNGEPKPDTLGAGAEQKK